MRKDQKHKSGKIYKARLSPAITIEGYRANWKWDLWDEFKEIYRKKFPNRKLPKLGTTIKKHYNTRGRDRTCDLEFRKMALARPSTREL